MSLALTSCKAALLAPWNHNPLWSAARAVASLDLRFAENKSLTDAASGQSLVTFTRASSGTYVGSDGVLRTATTNLLLRSEEFDNASWAAGAGGNASVTPNAIQSPVGTLTADLLDDTSAAAVLGKSQSLAITSSTRSYTASCYIKANSSSVASIRLSVGTGGTTVAGEVVVNLSTGATQWRAGAVGTSFSVVNVGDNWYRVAVVVTDNASGNTLCIAEFRPTFATTYSDTLNSAAQGSAYFWGAQLEQSSTVGEYIPTTSTINSAPRFDHNPTTGESLGLLVEEQRTNLLLRSEELATSPWFNSGLASIANNTTDVIDPSGQNKATKLVVAASAGIAGQGATLTATTYTGSVWLRCASGTVSGSLIVYLSASPFTNIGTQSVTITTQWQRFSVVTSTATAATYNFQIHNLNGGTVYAWGAQLEAGAFPTSYIPTTTATATRSADVASITGTNFSSWYRQDEGTVFADATIANTGSNRFIVGASDATVNEEVALYWNTVFNSLVTDGAASQANSFGGTVTAGSRALHSFAYKANDFQGYGNAVALSADTSGTLPTADRLTIGSRVNSTFWTNGTIRRLCYWGQRLPNPTLETITR